jgi:hypothetical protein
VLPLQQPLGQELALHAHAPALEQAWPVPHALQAAPPLPQVEFAEVRHWPLLSQQPFGHEVASQTQLVPLQR